MSEKKDAENPIAFESIEVNLDQPTPATKPVEEKTDYRDRWVRVSADFDNFRKRTQKEKQEWMQYGAESFIKAILPLMDNLERAIRLCSSEVPENKPILDGLKLVLGQFERVFKEHGVSSFYPEGEAFNPLLHDAIATNSKEGVEPGKVLEVHQKGYKLHDKLLRPAGVTVSSAPLNPEKAKDSNE